MGTTGQNVTLTGNTTDYAVYFLKVVVLQRFLVTILHELLKILVEFQVVTIGIILQKCMLIIPQ